MVNGEWWGIGENVNFDKKFLQWERETEKPRKEKFPREAMEGQGRRKLKKRRCPGKRMGSEKVGK